MPQVPYATPQAQAAAQGPDPTFMAMAANEVITEAKRQMGINKLKNPMWQAIDPDDGDFYRGDMEMTVHTAEGIRKASK